MKASLTMTKKLVASFSWRMAMERQPFFMPITVAAEEPPFSWGSSSSCVFGNRTKGHFLDGLNHVPKSDHLLPLVG